jgi:hypothetical protein
MRTVCHDTIADLLLALPPGQGGTVVGVRVRRCPYGPAWGVAGGHRKKRTSRAQSSRSSGAATTV